MDNGRYRQSKAQTQEFTNLAAELLAGQRGLEVQLEGLRVGVKVEKPESYDGAKGRDLNTWLFQVQRTFAIDYHTQKKPRPICSFTATWKRSTVVAREV